MGRPTNESFNWIIDYRVEIMAAFLAFFKFELVKGERNCLNSDWYGSDIVEYWERRRELTRIRKLGEDTPYDDLFSQERTSKARNNISKFICSWILHEEMQRYLSASCREECWRRFPS